MPIPATTTGMSIPATSTAFAPHCDRCGASVAFGWEAKHEEWHDLLHASIKEQIEEMIEGEVERILEERETLDQLEEVQEQTLEKLKVTNEALIKQHSQQTGWLVSDYRKHVGFPRPSKSINMTFDFKK